MTSKAITATQQQQLDAVRLDVFFESLAREGNVAQACRDSTLGRTTVDKWKKIDEDFAARWDAAIEDYRDNLRQAAYHRAVEGVFEPKIHEGEECFAYMRDEDGVLVLDDAGKPRIAKDAKGKLIRLGVHRYSDTLLLKLLTANCPEHRETSRLELGNVPGESFETKDPTFAGARKIAFALTMAMRKARNQTPCETPGDPPQDNSDLG